MKLIEIHLLQSFPVTCLNRDDVGAPKSVYFGGVQRARVSSQCWKRAIRKLAADNAPELFAGQRGHFHSELLKAKLQEKGIPADKAAEYAALALSSIGSKGKKEGQTGVALYLTALEIESIADGVAAWVKEAGTDKKKLAALDKKVVSEAIKNAPRRDFADVSVFGRMVADDHTLMLEGAGMFSHAISTHAASNEVDFFSAVDDTKPEDVTGAGHIGTLEMNSACYYRYIGVNVDLLFDQDHLGSFDAKERKAVLSTFLQAVLEAVPGARKNSMFGYTLPDVAMGVVRQGQPLSLVNAFEVPIKSSKQSGFVEPSKEALEAHWKSMKEIYSLGTNHRIKGEYLLSADLPLEKWIEQIVKLAMEG